LPRCELLEKFRYEKEMCNGIGFYSEQKGKASQNRWETVDYIP